MHIEKSIFMTSYCITGEVDQVHSQTALLSTRCSSGKRCDQHYVCICDLVSLFFLP